MFSAGHDGEVFDPVVGTIVIEMMDDLVGFELATKRLLHHETMFKDMTVLI